MKLKAVAEMKMEGQRPRRSCGGMILLEEHESLESQGGMGH